MTMKSRKCKLSRKQPARRATIIEDLDAPPSQAQCVAMIPDEGELYWHGRIKRALAEAGFITRRLEREEVHPVWHAWLTRTTFNLAPDNDTAVKQLRKVLRLCGIKIDRDVFSINDRRGDRLRCVFLLDLGSPGVLQPRPFYANNQALLWPAPR
jgi:hypothetical protein